MKRRALKLDRETLALLTDKNLTAARGGREEQAREVNSWLDRFQSPSTSRRASHQTRFLSGIQGEESPVDHCQRSTRGSCSQVRTQLPAQLATGW